MRPHGPGATDYGSSPQSSGAQRARMRPSERRRSFFWHGPHADVRRLRRRGVASGSLAHPGEAVRQIRVGRRLLSDDPTARRTAPGNVLRNGIRSWAQPRSASRGCGFLQCSECSRQPQSTAAPAPDAPATNELRASARPPPIRRRSGQAGRRNGGSRRCFRWAAQRHSGWAPDSEDRRSFLHHARAAQRREGRRPASALSKRGAVLLRTTGSCIEFPCPLRGRTGRIKVFCGRGRSRAAF
jgi:hypothetical protein